MPVEPIEISLRCLVSIFTTPTHSSEIDHHKHTIVYFKYYA